ncbi:MAG: acetyltransferase [Thermoplasmata archaeon]|jgi:GNAT superfamily N-acetyltransferase|nr:acetyltransferase [Thermoplasmata archaeon]
MSDLRIETATAEGIRTETAAWVELLADAVASGGGLGFLPPVPRAEGEAYFARVADEVEAGTRIVLVARLHGALVGSAQLDLCMRPNGMHRAEAQKVMVHRRARRRGIGRALMAAVDREALARGRTTLYLDTFAHQEARRMYEACGWTHAGDIPAFSVTAEGTLGTTSLYYKLLA